MLNLTFLVYILFFLSKAFDINLLFGTFIFGARALAALITHKYSLSKSCFDGNQTNTFGQKVIMKNFAKLVRNFWQSIKISHDF